MSEEIMSLLRELASKSNPFDDDDFDLHSACGGQTDDAYSYGYDAGQISLAKTILAMLDEAYDV